MRVCIIGPVNSEKSFGGVALFTESLADGFLREGHEVMIITDYSNRRNTLNGTPITSVCTNMARKNIKAIVKIRNKVKEFNPDITVSSLEYSISLLGKKSMKKNMKRIHFVHGFSSVRYYGFLKLFIMLMLDKLYGKNFEYTFVNSNFALMINNDIYNNKIDKVINIGLGYDFLEQIKDVGEIKNSRNGKLLYIGRLFDAKKVDIILLALKYIKEKYGEEYELDVVGNGPQENKLKEISLKYNLKVNFIGSVTPKETIEFYRNSEIFISLNPHEPFGMVYLEALANGCKIICPKSGGQLDFLVDYLDRVKLTNAFDYISVGEAIVEMLKREVEPIDCNHIIEKYSYDNVAKNIMDNLKN
ncbi:glycosyltransferase family 4 protein [uncultured Clostridium sp.]|uniref:glycosyltransferase family 4 protein n=1 Tax=uncultured Clostridium sp. TaxID=59620 RepID=UPI003216B1E3